MVAYFDSLDHVYYNFRSECMAFLNLTVQTVDSPFP